MSMPWKLTLHFDPFGLKAQIVIWARWELAHHRLAMCPPTSMAQPIHSGQWDDERAHFRI